MFTLVVHFLYVTSVWTYWEQTVQGRKQQMIDDQAVAVASHEEHHWQSAFPWLLWRLAKFCPALCHWKGSVMTSFANTHGRLHAYMRVVFSTIANMSLSPSLLFPHGRWLDVNQTWIILKGCVYILLWGKWSQGNDVTHTLPGNACPQSSYLTVPLWAGCAVQGHCGTGHPSGKWCYTSPGNTYN